MSNKPRKFKPEPPMRKRKHIDINDRASVRSAFPNLSDAEYNKLVKSLHDIYGIDAKTE